LVTLKLKLGRYGGHIRLRQGHIVILGRSGSGKSNTAKVLISELARKGVRALVLDWSGEYVIPGFVTLKPGEDISLDVLPSAASLEPELVDVVVDLFDAVFHLSQPQLYMLRLAAKRAVSQRYSGVAGLLAALEEVPIRSYYDHETKAALVRRLAPLSEGRIGRALEGGLMMQRVFEHNVIVDLSVFRSVYAKRLFSLLLLKEVYDSSIRREIDEGIVHATLIEEAWNVIPYRRPDAEPSIGERLFAELRKYGECLIAVAQNPTEIARSIINNAEIIVAHAMLPHEFEVIGLPPYTLERGEAVVVERGRVKLVRVRKFR